MASGAREPVRTTRVRRPQWTLKTGTWNVASLKNKEKELVEEMKQYHLEIVGLSETKMRGSGTKDLYEMDAVLLWRRPICSCSSWSWDTHISPVGEQSG